MTPDAASVAGIVIGLGNPGAAYAATRHNIGFWAVDRLAGRHGGSWVLGGEIGRDGWVARIELAGRPLVLVKPRTFMNRVGRAASRACQVFAAGPERIVAVCDDADLDLGRVRVRTAGSAGGHNGLRSLITALHTDAIARVKLGVRGTGREASDLANYVLQTFDADELPVAEALAERGADAVALLVTAGAAAAMDRFNGRSASGEAAPA